LLTVFNLCHYVKASAIANAQAGAATAAARMEAKLKAVAAAKANDALRKTVRDMEAEMATMEYEAGGF